MTFERTFAGTVLRLSDVRLGVGHDPLDRCGRVGAFGSACHLPRCKAPGNRPMPKKEGPDQSDQSDDTLRGTGNSETDATARARTKDGDRRLRPDETHTRIGGGLGVVVAEERRSHQP